MKSLCYCVEGIIVLSLNWAFGHCAMISRLHVGTFFREEPFRLPKKKVDALRRHGCSIVPTNEMARPIEMKFGIPSSTTVSVCSVSYRTRMDDMLVVVV